MGEIPLMTENGTFVINGLSESSYRSCIARQAYFSITTREKRTRLESFYIPRA